MATIDQTSSCSCGKANIDIKGPVIGRFFCHCTICQSLYKEPCADVTIVRARSVIIRAPCEMEFRRYKSPPALNRGVCKACGSPVLGLTPGPSSLGLAFVASRTFESPELVPPPQYHVFYHRSVANVDDALPKISGYWRSEFAVLSLVLLGLSNS
jgi:hypothetical protein